MQRENGRTALVEDPGRLRLLAQRIADGALSPVDLVQRYLDRIACVEPQISCWRVVDAAGALAAAHARHDEARAGRLRGALHGVPVAIKDIIDVEGIPTRANCRARDEVAPAAGDAEIVRAMRAQGAIVLGKVHTTEYAFFDPSPARNPHNPGHTPGGSSSGSAAAVAAGMAPLAIGTQTVASVNRPAAYCGVAAFKPSTGSLSAFGITPLGPSYDTPGFYGWSVNDAAFGYEAVAPGFAGSPARKSTRVLSIVIPDDAHIADAVPDVKRSIAGAARRLTKAGHQVSKVKSPIDFARLFRIQRTTMLYEAGRALKFLFDHPKGLVGEKLTAAMRDGLAIDQSRYLAERGEIDGMRRAFFSAFAKADVFMWPATPGPAPEGLAWTGDPKYIAPWTALGGPIVTIPIGKAANGLPLGCIISSRPGSDRAMCQWARRVADIIERHS